MEFAKSKNSFLLALALLMSVFNATMSTDVRHDERALVIDGQRRIIISGSIHYPRSTPEMWPDLIKKAKEGGLDAIETYVFWNGHEPRPREYNFEGNYDIIRFFKEIQNAGLYAVLRIGPYICGEWNYGGLPAWLRDIPGMKFREDNEPFKREMQNFTTYIVDKVREANLFAAQGGPIILAQIENEYGNIWKAYDENSRWNYITWCADMANSLDVGVPWIMCQQQPAPSNVIDTCNGFYCHHFSPSNKNNPKFWTENWTGWFKAWDKPDFHRPAEDVAYAVARFFQTRGTFQNYYMYHGGTNFGRTSGGPYITSTYDYDAPLDEYGNLRQPKWGHLKELHTALKSMEKHLVYGEHNESRYGNITTTKYTLDGTSACFISNEDVIDLNATLEGSVYSVPAWSVSLLPDCTTVAYNTAKVKTQTSVMVKRPNTLEQEPEALQWSWMPENLKPFLTDRHAPFRTKKLLDQIVTTADQSDYLWYTTSLDHHREEKFTLYVNTTGHVLYAFVNGELVGHRHSQDWPFIFQFQAPVTLRKGRNYISLLSATVGLKNYGAYYELMPAGIVGGPVKLVGSNNNASIDVSHNTWSYETGLWGEHTHVHLEESGSKWKEDVVPVNRPFTWYKSTFQAPVGSETVVVDLLGLNKGMAWVNGNNLGRYWPSYIANEMGGCHHCDYRGNFNTDSYKEKCLTGCGEPSQRWYHVPRSFLKAGEPNTILLFEEAGGDPSQVNFQTVATGPVCVNAEKGDAVTLSCQHGKTIARVDTASFDVTRGKCGAYEGGCESKSAYYFLTEACVGKESCTVEYTDSLHSSDCNGDKGSSVLTIQATCS